MPNIIRRFTLTTSGESSQDVLLDATQPPQATRMLTTFASTVTGTATYTLYYSYQTGALASITRWLALSDMTDATTSVDAQFNRVPTALKLTQTAGAGQVIVDVTVELQS